jgi:hypothetical protein
MLNSRWSATLTLLFGILLLGFSPGLFAQANSTPEERARWVELSHKLETDPLDGALNKEAEKAVKRLIEVHDVHVALCGSVFTDLNASKSKYSGQITRQYLLASAAFVIENPEKAAESGLVNLYAVQSVLKVYGAILQKKSDSRSPSLDAFLKDQDAGTLEASVRKKCG